MGARRKGGVIGIGRVVEIKIQIAGAISADNIGLAIVVPIDDGRGELFEAHPRYDLLQCDPRRKRGSRLNSVLRNK
jgi:hypothetical protein